MHYYREKILRCTNLIRGNYGEIFVSFMKMHWKNWSSKFWSNQC